MDAGTGSRRELQRRSSAVTLSDLEMAVFPELIYSLVLANIMSPRIWRWRKEPWFAGIASLKPYRRILRVKQYIMEHYAFNLDLDTWGLTTKERELARFRGLISEDALKRLSPFFGCEGDGRYFETDLRVEFGLRDYETSVIPYWKTETVEAMDAFRYAPGYSAGAGECVSLAALYAAALFIVARIDLKDIYLMLTPLHCQAFVDADEGILTNNRRVVTKRMWFNGTTLSNRARRALENEQVTIVAHETGWVHLIHEWHTMSEGAYRRFADRLRSYLSAPLTDELLGNFLRQEDDLQRCFQVRWKSNGVAYYVPMERAFELESGKPFRVTDGTRDRLLATLPVSGLRCQPLVNRVILDDVEDFLRRARIGLNHPQGVEKLAYRLESEGLDAERVVKPLSRFFRTVPQLPDLAGKKRLPSGTPLDLSVDMSRREILSRLLEIRSDNELVDLAFHAYRDLNRTDAAPVLLAAVRRNPASIRGVGRIFGQSATGAIPEQLLQHLREMPGTSIYVGPGRLAQPDEVWNFGRGDGAEKALLLANIVRSGNPAEELAIEISPAQAILCTPRGKYSFPSRKGLCEQTWVIPVGKEEGIGPAGS